MPETLQTNGLWHVTLVETDLVEQAGLNAKDFKQDLGFFLYKERKVIMSHRVGEHLVVSIEGEEDNDLDQFMKGLSTVVGYNPFCKYSFVSKEKHIPDLITYEWDKVNPEKRYKELDRRSNVSKLERID